MDKYKQFVKTLKKATQDEPATPLIPVEVKAITGETCTVLYGDLELTDVRLKATENGSNNALMMYPKVGSMVLVGSLTGDLNDLAVLKIDELEKIQYDQDGLFFTLNTTTGKVKLGNAAISLRDLFDMLATLLKTFQVFTPAGPSLDPLPTTKINIQLFEKAYSDILE